MADDCTSKCMSVENEHCCCVQYLRQLDLGRFGALDPLSRMLGLDYLADTPESFNQVSRPLDASGTTPSKHTAQYVPLPFKKQLRFVMLHSTSSIFLDLTNGNLMAVMSAHERPEVRNNGRTPHQPKRCAVSGRYQAQCSKPRLPRPVVSCR